MSSDTDQVLAFVKANLEQPCPILISRNIFLADKKGRAIPGTNNPEGSHPTACICRGTGYVPRPEAVELLGQITQRCGHTPTVTATLATRVEWSCRVYNCPSYIPRSPTEQQMALIDWAVAQKYFISTWQREDGVQVWEVEGENTSEVAETLQAAMQRILVATEGWTDVKEINK